MSDFKSSVLPLENTGSFEKTIISYINGHETLRKLIQYDPDLAGLKKRIAAGATEQVDRKLLVNLLTEQYRSLSLSPESQVQHNINSLLNENTFTVTTGHQLNFFSGPLYVLFKLISTINLSEKLKAEFPGHHFIPVYWMATEDHDIAEINNINLFSKKLSFETSYQGKAGKLQLNEIESFRKSVTDVLGESETANELAKIIQTAYNDNSDLATATRTWTHQLLGKYGLVIIDADEKELKQKFISIAEMELRDEFISEEVNKAIGILKPDFNVQVNPREINLFYIHGNSRNRIVKENNLFRVLNSDIQFSGNEIFDELKSHPEKFSPNVLMRPLYQEMILPNIAYIGGPSEITYWLELKFVFEKLNIPMPVLLLRNCAVIVEQSVLNKWNKLGFGLMDIFKTENELTKMYLEKKDLGNFSLKSSAEKITDIYEQIISEISVIDQSLKATAESEKQKSLHSIAMIEEKVTRAFKRKEETEINQIRKVREKLFPGGSLQERNETLLPFYLKWGSDFISGIKNSFDPLNPDFTVLEEIPESQQKISQ